MLTGRKEPAFPSRTLSSPYCAGILGHDGHGHNDGHVVAGFLGQNVALVELPEIGIAGALDRALHRARPGVVGRHGQVPVAELGVKIFQMMGGGAGGFFRVLAIVHPPVALEAVTLAAAGHELPHAAGARAGKRQRLESDSACAR